MENEVGPRSSGAGRAHSRHIPGQTHWTQLKEPSCIWRRSNQVGGRTAWQRSRPPWRMLPNGLNTCKTSGLLRCWTTMGLRGGSGPATLYAGRFSIDWLVNLAFFARRHDYAVRQITVLSEFLKIVDKMGALSKAKVLSGATHYPVLRRMSGQWATKGNALHMCPVVMTYGRFTLAMSLLSGHPSELTAFRGISDLGQLADLVDSVFIAQGAMDKDDTSMAEYMLHRALILGAKTDSAKFVRSKTNIMAVMCLIVCDDDRQPGISAGAWQYECLLPDEPQQGFFDSPRNLTRMILRIGPLEHPPTNFRLWFKGRADQFPSTNEGAMAPSARGPPRSVSRGRKARE